MDPNPSVLPTVEIQLHVCKIYWNSYLKTESKYFSILLLDLDLNYHCYMKKMLENSQDPYEDLIPLNPPDSDHQMDQWSDPDPLVRCANPQHCLE